jgi:hypothetical protein
MHKKNRRTERGKEREGQKDGRMTEWKKGREGR